MPATKSSYDDDLQLAQACLAGDNDATSAIHTSYGQRLLGLLINRGATNTEASDLLGDLWGELAVGKNGQQEGLLLKYHGKCSLYTWLATVATHRLVDLKRRQRFQGNLPAMQDDPNDGGNNFDQLPARAVDYTESALTRLMRDSLREALKECPSDAYLLLQLVYIHGVMQREAARMFGWHESKISRTLDQAMADIAARTIRNVRAADPWLEVNWEDFLQLCQSGEDLFSLSSKS